jgi:hypothetical protein
VPGSALDLAVFRVTVALVIAASGSARVAVTWAALPAAARVAPTGVGWLLPHLPITPDLVWGARALTLVACVTGALGLYSRASFAVVTLSAAYVLLVPQLGGAVFHDHHLLWFAALLAVSPCGDALSLDAWRARRRGRCPPARGAAHGLAGLIYFFPAVHKLREMGLDWVLSDNLQHQLWWKWAQDPALLPSVRFDRYPWLLRALAGFALLFELSFGALLMARRTRLWALAAALAFHLGTHALMGIDFSVLYVCYLGFLPWSEWRERRGAAPAASTPDGVAQRGVGSLLAVGGLLVVGVTVAGAAGAMQAYPFACYPTFARDPGAYMPALAVDLARADGDVERLPSRLYKPAGQRGVALDWRLAGAYGDFSEARLRAWWQGAAAQDPLRAWLHTRAPRGEGACHVRFSRVRVSVDPDRRGERERERDTQAGAPVPLAELPCGAW